MENKKLNEQELENVSGGQAVLPLKSNVSDDRMIVGSGITAHCKHCGFSFPVPSSRLGKQVECQSCHEMFIV